jgi:hypothetical protein
MSLIILTDWVVGEPETAIKTQQYLFMPGQPLTISLEPQDGRPFNFTLQPHARAMPNGSHSVEEQYPGALTQLVPLNWQALYVTLLHTRHSTIIACSVAQAKPVQLLKDYTSEACHLANYITVVLPREN